MASVLRWCATVSVADQRSLTIRVATREASRRELQQALVSWAVAARSDGAVREAHVSEDVLTPGVFEVEATMEDAAELEVHLRSRGFGALMGALTVLAHDVSVWVRQPVPAFGADPLAMIRRLRSHPGEASDGDLGTTRRER